MGDFQRIDLQDAQRYMLGMVEMTTDITPLANAGLAWTMEHDDEIIAIGGLVPGDGVAVAWTLLSRHANRHLSAIHRAVRRFLSASPFPLIEATVDVGFTEGEKWMKMLGFRFERVLPGYRPDGADMMLFVRTQP